MIASAKFLSQDTQARIMQSNVIDVVIINITEIVFLNQGGHYSTVYV